MNRRDAEARGCMIQFDRNKSLQELDNKDWGGSIFESHIGTECYRLRDVPLKDYPVEDLRIMIGQNICLDVLVTLAIERLQCDPLAEGNFYRGDLHVNMLLVSSNFWKENPELKLEVERITERGLVLASSANEGEPDNLKSAFESFLRVSTSQR